MMKLPRLRASNISWRKFNALGAIASAMVWVLAEIFGWINYVSLVSRLSFITQIIAFIAAWRSDVPNEKERQQS